MIGIKTHELKTWPEYFKAVKYGEKRFELRKNDRGFAVGDFLKLREWDNLSKRYTGDQITCEVTFIIDSEFGLEQGNVCMSIRPVD